MRENLHPLLTSRQAAQDYETALVRLAKAQELSEAFRLEHLRIECLLRTAHVKIELGAASEAMDVLGQIAGRVMRDCRVQDIGRLNYLTARAELSLYQALQDEADLQRAARCLTLADEAFVAAHHREWLRRVLLLRGAVAHLDPELVPADDDDVTSVEERYRRLQDGALDAVFDPVLPDTVGDTSERVGSRVTVRLSADMF